MSHRGLEPPLSDLKGRCASNYTNDSYSSFSTGSRIRICNIFFLKEAPLPVGIYRHSHYRIRTDTVTALNDMPLPVGLSGRTRPGTRIRTVMVLSHVSLPIGVVGRTHRRIRTDTDAGLNRRPLPIGLCELDHIFVNLYSRNRISFSSSRVQCVRALSGDGFL